MTRESIMTKETRSSPSAKLAILPMWVIDRIKEEMRLGPAAWQAITDAVEQAEVPQVLTCEVKLPPGTVIGQGTAVSTLMLAIQQRASQPAHAQVFSNAEPEQPHPDPIAWMVGTAFWWTKEEAERDAAATGLKIVGVGPMTATATAEQRQGEPVAYQWRCKAVHEGSQWRHWVDCTEEDYRGTIDNPGPTSRGIIREARKLYTHADPGEVEQLRAVRDGLREDAKWLREELDKALLQLAERDALLRELIQIAEAREQGYADRLHGGVVNGKAADSLVAMMDRMRLAVSSRPELGAPIAWHVGGNGYDRICFEEPADLPGHPCIQPIHDQRQLIELLKRYDLRDEDLPPDERAHGIPGTTFQRLNALANQGE